jgi:hypothetical protein
VSCAGNALIADDVYGDVCVDVGVDGDADAACFFS